MLKTGRPCSGTAERTEDELENRWGEPSSGFNSWVRYVINPLVHKGFPQRAAIGSPSPWCGWKCAMKASRLGVPDEEDRHHPPRRQRDHHPVGYGLRLRRGLHAAGGPVRGRGSGVRRGPGAVASGLGGAVLADIVEGMIALSGVVT